MTQSENQSPPPNDSVQQAARGIVAFGQLVAIVAKHPVITLLTIFYVLITCAALGAGYVWWQNPSNTSTQLTTIINSVKPTPEVETQRLYDGSEADDRINEGFETVREKIGFDRVVSYDLHNNQQGLSGIPWGYASAGNVALRKGVKFDLQAAQRLRTTMWAEIIRRTMPRDGTTNCISIDTEDLTSSALRSWANDHGTQYIHACGMRDKEGTPIGFILGTYLNRQAPRTSDAQAETALKRLANEVIEIHDMMPTHRAARPVDTTVVTTELNPS